MSRLAQCGKCPHIIQLLLSVLLHAANVVHWQIDPLVDPAEQLPVKVGEDALLHLDGPSGSAGKEFQTLANRGRHVPQNVPEKAKSSVPSEWRLPACPWWERTWPQPWQAYRRTCEGSCCFLRAPPAKQIKRRQVRMLLCRVETHWCDVWPCRTFQFGPRGPRPVFSDLKMAGSNSALYS